MARSLSPAGMLLKWGVIPIAFFAMGYFVVAPYYSGSSKPRDEEPTATNSKKPSVSESTPTDTVVTTQPRRRSRRSSTPKPAPTPTPTTTAPPDSDVAPVPPDDGSNDGAAGSNVSDGSGPQFEVTARPLSSATPRKPRHKKPKPKPKPAPSAEVTITPPDDGSNGGAVDSSAGQ